MVPHTASPPHLILNFDLNGTLVLHDTSKHVRQDDYMLVCALAKNTIRQWQSDSPPMSYKQHVDKVLFPGDRSDSQLIKSRQKTIASFLDWLKTTSFPEKMDVLKHHESIQKKFKNQQTGNAHFTVFPSFYRLLDKLREMKLPFTIVLRSFGKDLATVVEEIENHPSGVHISEWAHFNKGRFTIEEREHAFATINLHDYALIEDPKATPIESYLNEFFYYGGRRYQVINKTDKRLELREVKAPQSLLTIAIKVALIFTVVVPIVAAMYKMSQTIQLSFYKKERTIEKVEEIFDHFLTSGNHIAVQDDWKTWNDDQEKSRSGKPFFYDHTKKHAVKNLSLFFDDNITGEDQDIIQPCEIFDRNKTTAKLINKLIFCVNTVEAIEDEDYYIKRVLAALQDYTHPLS